MRIFCQHRWHAHSDFLDGSLEGYGRDVARIMHRWREGQETFNLLTSGSTGPPRTIRFDRAFIESRARITAAALNLRPHQNALLCLPVERAGGFMVLMRALVLPLDLVIVPPTAHPLADPALPPIHFAAFTPYQVKKILDQSPERLAAVHTVIIGGAPIPVEVERRLRRMPNTIYHTYGMTETLSHIALRNITRGERRFRPLPDVALTLRDNGTLQIAFPTWDYAVDTRDVVSLHADGIEWKGRLDHVINSGGIKIYPDVLEQKIADVPRIREWRRKLNLEFYVVGKPHPELGQSVALVYSARRFISTEEWKSALTAALSRYEIPRSYHYKKALKRTDNGKIIRTEA